MPSHYTHMIFGGEAAQRAAFPVTHRRWFFLGCQGPDLFFHNQRRNPNCFFWGRSLHRQEYGSFCALMEQSLAEASKGWDTPEGNYLIGFITHALLDRAVHPYIHAFSDPGTGRGGKYHPFIERLIDVAMTCCFWKAHPWESSCIELMSLGERPPEAFVMLLVDAAVRHFPASRTSESYLRVRNAYADTLGLLQLTDSWNRETADWVFDSSRKDYLLALFHPPAVPRQADVLNVDHSPWHDPWEQGNIRRESFLELFEEAVSSAGAVLAQLTRQPPAEESRSKAAAGTENLNGSQIHTRANRPAAGPLHLEGLFAEAAALLTGGDGTVFSCKPR